MMTRTVQIAALQRTSNCKYRSLSYLLTSHAVMVLTAAVSACADFQSGNSHINIIYQFLSLMLGSFK
jgi:hypothetical protein